MSKTPSPSPPSTPSTSSDCSNESSTLSNSSRQYEKEVKDEIEGLNKQLEQARRDNANLLAIHQHEIRELKKKYDEDMDTFSSIYNFYFNMNIHDLLCIIPDPPENIQIPCPPTWELKFSSGDDAEGNHNLVWYLGPIVTNWRVDPITEEIIHVSKKLKYVKKVIISRLKKYKTN